jgi:ATP-dependent helicase YprA (DUF1998 family)
MKFEGMILICFLNKDGGGKKGLYKCKTRLFQLLKNQALWPDALLQLNPSYEMASTIQDLVNEGKLHPLCTEIFCADNGDPIRLYLHQQEAIEKALHRKHFVVTSGTGSGKTLTYFVPIFESILCSNLV